MLHNVFNLTKVFLLTAFRRSENRRPWLKFLYAFLFLYLAFIAGFISYGLIDTLIPLHQEEAFTGIVLMLVISFTLFTTIISCINVFYFSKDNLFILPLPLKGKEVLSAKLNVLLVYSYTEILFFGLIPLLVYGVMCEKGLMFFLMVIPVLLLLPVIPLVLVSFFVMSVMALTGGIRNKALVQGLSMTFGILFSLAISLVSSSISTNEEVMQLLEKVNGLSELYQKTFFTMPLAMTALNKGNLLSLLGLAAVSALAYALLVLYGEKVYYRGMIGSLYSSEGVSSKKLDGESAFSSRGLAYSYVMKELKTYLRRPTFFVQLVLPGLILPAFMILVFYVSLRSEAGMIKDILRQFFADRGNDGYVLGALVFLHMFCSLYSYISVVAISKDGHDACAMKYLPIPFYRQLIYKMIPDFLSCLIGSVISTVLLVILIGLPLRFIVMALPICLSYFALHGFLILLDAARPKLNWSRELEVCKNNLLMLGSIVFGLLGMALVALCVFVLHMNAILQTVCLTLLYLLLTAAGYFFIKKEDIRLAAHIQ